MVAMASILVTGGAGFVGSHLTDRLISLGHRVTVLDNLEPQVHGGGSLHMNPEAHYLWGDLRDKGVLLKALEDQEVVFHLAAMVGVGQSMYQVDRYADVNVLGTARLLQAMVERGTSVRKVVVASSMSIYGEGLYRCPSEGNTFAPQLRSEKRLRAHDWEVPCPSCGSAGVPTPTPESKPLEPTSVYAITKRNQEDLCLAIGRAYGIPTVALRYFNIYGPRQSLSNPYTGVCAIFQSRINNGRPLVIFEDGLQTRDFVAVEDIVQANVLAIGKKGGDYRAINVGSGRAQSILAVARLLLELRGSRLEPRVEGRYRTGDIRHCFADINLARKLLGYRPRVSLARGFAHLVDWSRGQAAVDRFEEAHQELVQRGLVAD